MFVLEPKFYKAYVYRCLKFPDKFTYLELIRLRAMQTTLNKGEKLQRSQLVSLQEFVVRIKGLTS